MTPVPKKSSVPALIVIPLPLGAATAAEIVVVPVPFWLTQLKEVSEPDAAVI